MRSPVLLRSPGQEPHSSDETVPAREAAPPAVDPDAEYRRDTRRPRHVRDRRRLADLQLDRRPRSAVFRDSAGVLGARDRRGRVPEFLGLAAPPHTVRASRHSRATACVERQPRRRLAQHATAPAVDLGERRALSRHRRTADPEDLGEIRARRVHRNQYVDGAGQQRRHAGTMAADRAVAVHDDADGHAARMIERAASRIGIGNRHQVAEAQAAEPVAFAGLPVRQLDVVIAAPCGVLAEARAHQARRHEMGDRHVQAPVAREDAPTAQQARRAVQHLDARPRRQPQPEAVRHDLHTVADPQPHQHVGREIHQHVIDAAVLAGDHPDLAAARPADHPRHIADARGGHQRVVGAVARAGHFAAVVVQRDAGLHMVAGEADAQIADPLVQRDAAGAGQHARDTVVADAIGRRLADRMRDLAGDGGGDQLVGVDAWARAAVTRDRQAAAHRESPIEGVGSPRRHRGAAARRVAAYR